MNGKLVQHWADTYAERVIRERGEKKQYTCASGITPSGTVHIGNFREIISVEIIVRALRERGKKVRFLYSWDDFDVFRKVPQNIPQSEVYTEYLRKPIVDIPDPYQRMESYARGNEHDIENILQIVGIHPQYIYQATEYRKGMYAEGIRRALLHRKDIMDILNKYRSTPLSENWYPVSVFSSFTGKDNTSIIAWDGMWILTYKCEETNREETIDIRNTTLVKLLWRVDWPMRWKYEDVDFEPAGKDHHSQGGSFDTARDIVRVVYEGQAPVTFQYDFVRIKGGSGKLSSSSGEVVSVEDMLAIYQPEIVRYLFASTRPNSEFAISFDLDVIKVYEDYDKCERIYFGEETVGDARKAKERRIYELSQIDFVSETIPHQVPFRHLCSVLQTYGGNIEQTLQFLSVSEKSEALVKKRCECALYWITNYAPEEFVFTLTDSNGIFMCENENIANAFSRLSTMIETQWDILSDKEINNSIYTCAREANIEPKDFFRALYLRLVGKEKGPRLGTFFTILGKERVLQYLQVTF